MSNVLVIHLSDHSTDFLKRIYEGKGYDVINDGTMPDEELIEQIKSHDKIIMMGHGTPHGLLNPSNLHSAEGGLFTKNLFFIDSRHADLLREKETITIWCYSSSFCLMNDLVGLHTGMIISEVNEQKYALGKVYLNESEQLENMNRFADVFSECIEMSPDDMRRYVLEHYTGDDEVTKFNRRNIHLI